MSLRERTFSVRSVVLAGAGAFESSFACFGTRGTGAAGYAGLSLWFNRPWTDAMRELLHLPPRRVA